jgi:hypothetical protein
MGVKERDGPLSLTLVQAFSSCPYENKRGTRRRDGEIYYFL